MLQSTSKTCPPETFSLFLQAQQTSNIQIITAHSHIKYTVNMTALLPKSMIGKKLKATVNFIGKPVTGSNINALTQLVLSIGTGNGVNQGYMGGNPGVYMLPLINNIIWAPTTFDATSANTITSWFINNGMVSSMSPTDTIEVKVLAASTMLPVANLDHYELSIFFECLDSPYN